MQAYYIFVSEEFYQKDFLELNIPLKGKNQGEKGSKSPIL